MSAKELFYIINNQLTIVIGHAELLASETDDLETRKRCEEIGTAAQKVSQLLNEMATKQ